MKYLLKVFLSIVVHLWSKLYSLKVANWIKNKQNLLYTMWISHFFDNVGDKSHFSYPIVIQGEGQRRINIGSHTRIGHHTVLGCWRRYGKDDYFESEIVIGDNCNIGEYCHISAINKIKIGNGLLTGRFVYIGDNSHGGLSFTEANIPPVNRRLKSKGGIVIGKNVWIGDKVSIFGGVTIGDNVIIGAGSIVVHDISSNSIAVGAPARIIKTL